jgi:hypothetical protein
MHYYQMHNTQIGQGDTILRRKVQFKNVKIMINLCLSYFINTEGMNNNLFQNF